MPDLHDAEQECALFLRSTAAQPQQFTERFMTAAPQGIIATAMGNAYYDSHQHRYVFAIAKQMQKEYGLMRGLKVLFCNSIVRIWQWMALFSLFKFTL